MAEKRAHEYQITVKQVKDIKGEPVNDRQLELIFKNHDDVFNIMNMLTEKGLFATQEDARQFVLGLKLFGEVMIRNKQMALFSEMQPAFMSFMQKLKGQVK